MIKKLEIDVGNSFCKWRLKSSAEVLSEGRARLNALKGMFASIKHEEVAEINVCSVAGAEYDVKLKSELLELCSVAPCFFSVSAFCSGVKNNYKDPSKMGADRWLASIAAANKYPNKTICIADCGSAVNVEFISSDSEHIGGYIVPGLLMMQDSLLKNTAHVNQTTQLQSIMPGMDTGSNVANGCLVTILSLLEKLQRKMFEEDGVLIVTGGDAEVLMEYLDDQAVVYVKDLVLDGFEYLSS